MFHFSSSHLSLRVMFGVATIFLTVGVFAAGDSAASTELTDAYKLKKGMCLSFDVVNKQTICYGTSPREIEGASKLVICVLDDADSATKGYKLLTELFPAADKADGEDLEDLGSIVPDINYMKPTGEDAGVEGRMIKPFLPIPKEDGQVKLSTSYGKLSVRAILNQDGSKVKYSAAPDQAVEIQGLEGANEIKLIKSDYLLILEKDGMPQTYAEDSGIALPVMGAGAAQFLNVRMNLTNVETLSEDELTSCCSDALALIAALGARADKSTTAAASLDAAYKDALDLTKEIDSFIVKNPNSKYNTRLKKFAEWVDSKIESANAKAGYNVGDVPEAFELLDTKGTSVSLSSFKDKVVLLDFWASWCGPCRAAMPGIKALNDKFGAKGLVILGLSCDSDEKAMKEFVEKEKMAWTNMLCPEALAKTYGVAAIPMTYLIGKDGKVVGSNLDAKTLEETITELLK